MQSIARRIVDPDMLRLIKQWLTGAGRNRPTGMARGAWRAARPARRGVPQGGVISPLVANLYMNRFLKYWRQTGRGEAWQAHVINYADDFVILSRGHAAEALAWTDRVMARLGLSLNRTKTLRVRCTDGAVRLPGLQLRAALLSGRPAAGTSGPARRSKSVQRLKDKVGAILVPGNMGPWEEVRDTLNRLLRGWCGYFSPGSHYVTDRAIEAHLYDHVRNFLVRRHKLPSRGIGHVQQGRGVRHLGVLRLPQVPPAGALS